MIQNDEAKKKRGTNDICVRETDIEDSAIRYY